MNAILHDCMYSCIRASARMVPGELLGELVLMDRSQ